jgi:hypothetical protein
MSEDIKNINELFTSKPSDKGADMGGILVLFVIVCLIIVMYFKMTQTHLWLDWDNQKCSPSLLFFNGLINPNVDETAFQSIQTNFIDCLKPYTNVLKSEKYKVLNKSMDTLVTVNRNIEESYETYSKKIEKIRDELEKQPTVLDVSFQVIEKAAYSQKLDFEKTFLYVTMNIKRLFAVLDRITTYMKDLLIYKVSVNVDKRFMNIEVDDPIFKKPPGIDEFQDYINSQYEKTYNTKYSAAFDNMKSIRQRQGFDENTTDFSSSINLADQAIQEYDRMIKLIQRFESQNQELFEKTNQYCAELKNHNYSCSILLPTWKD